MNFRSVSVKTLVSVSSRSVVLAAADALDDRVDAALRIGSVGDRVVGLAGVAAQGTSTSKSSSRISSRLSM